MRFVRVKIGFFLSLNRLFSCSLRLLFLLSVFLFGSFFLSFIRLFAIVTNYIASQIAATCFFFSCSLSHSFLLLVLFVVQIRFIRHKQHIGTFHQPTSFFFFLILFDENPIFLFSTFNINWKNCCRIFVFIFSIRIGSIHFIIHSKVVQSL